eukprot:149523_1
MMPRRNSKQYKRTQHRKSKQVPKKEITNTVKTHDRQCIICLECPPEDPLRLKCGHVFCGDCIALQIHRKKYCPICKSPRKVPRNSSWSKKRQISELTCLHIFEKWFWNIFANKKTNDDFKKYYQSFIDQGFADPLNACECLDEQCLKELGVGKIGHRKYMIRTIREHAKTLFLPEDIVPSEKDQEITKLTSLLESKQDEIAAITGSITQKLQKYMINKDKELDRLKQEHGNLKASYKTVLKELQSTKSNQDALKRKYQIDVCQIQRLCDKTITEQKESQFQMNQLNTTYTALKAKYNKLQTAFNQFSYLSWNATQIANWILNINKKRYKKYYDSLVKNMRIENINGRCLHEFNKNDLHRFGIFYFEDKCDILIAINQLIRNKNTAQKLLVSKEEYKAVNCVICLDNTPRYACVPCGHLNICDLCKDKLSGTCPICQTEYQSIVKIFHDFQ